MESLHRLGEADHELLTSIVNAVVTKQVCSRTVWRDLKTLGELGFVTSRRVKLSVGGGRKYLYAMTVPQGIKKLCDKHRKD